MEKAYKGTLSLALAALALLAVAQGAYPADTAPSPTGLGLIAADGVYSLYQGADIAARRTLSYTRTELENGLLLRVGPGFPLPEASWGRQARSLREMVGHYVPADAHVALSQETIYALCDMVSERFPVYATLSDGMRSPLEQKRLQNEAFSRRLATSPASEALIFAQYEAPTDGTSEHYLPTAFDVRLEGALNWQQSDPMRRNADGVWLCDHAHKFGFIRRYPPEKAAETGVLGEETHFRYVGREHALVMRLTGWCLEEYLDALARAGAFTLTAAGEWPVYILCQPMSGQGAAFACPEEYTGSASADNMGNAVCVLTRDPRRD